MPKNQVRKTALGRQLKDDPVSKRREAELHRRRVTSDFTIHVALRSSMQLNPHRRLVDQPAIRRLYLDAPPTPHARMCPPGPESFGPNLFDPRHALHDEAQPNELGVHCTDGKAA
ncbi:hypothetical protein M409DRAFT_48421 [Zasmidium cellare ATCC 36951]|uniref:Uncharacterized protein n=1 Tax=Zasmidium cellare ATCC 36951 TaxID=1080233 RepID=A0A6A6D5E6_ZASCE|nr:uncharacterized protein M409DRAFT_48421 [Zasmidium cellare ATCC 36951]KAF2173442.1 hypothetical protein M409DRAFT_48421 [Zasmidium cellare ATCC 36951]